MKKRIILLSLLSMCALSACAVSKDKVFSRTDYWDTVFENNYYKVKEFDISSSEDITLDKTKNKVFESYDELKSLQLDEDVNNGSVTYDSIIHSNLNTDYGTKKCLGNYDDSFNYGILSKLTDGILFCDQKTYQGVRVQIDESGFSHEYNKRKTIKSCDYFALSFKAGSDYTNPLYPSSANYKIKLKITLIDESMKDRHYSKTYSYVMNDVTRDRYRLFGFVIPEDYEYGISGIGISYELLESNEDAKVKHCLHLYETLFVNPKF